MLTFFVFGRLLKRVMQLYGVGEITSIVPRKDLKVANVDDALREHLTDMSKVVVVYDRDCDNTIMVSPCCMTDHI